jgi:hypothetical protein
MIPPVSMITKSVRSPLAGAGQFSRSIVGLINRGVCELDRPTDMMPELNVFCPLPYA